jgi:plasmid stability protein
MATLTIRNLDEDLKLRLRVEAAAHGHSIEEELRRILRRALSSRQSETGLASRIRRRFEVHGGVDLKLPPRKDVSAWFAELDRLASEQEPLA